jgi:hypothetical protein
MKKAPLVSGSLGSWIQSEEAFEVINSLAENRLPSDDHILPPTTSRCSKRLPSHPHFNFYLCEEKFSGLSSTFYKLGFLLTWMGAFLTQSNWNLNELRYFSIQSFLLLLTFVILSIVCKYRTEIPNRHPKKSNPYPLPLTPNLPNVIF